MSEQFTFRAVQESDAEALLAVYAPYVANTAVTFEYDIPSIEEFRNRIGSTLLKFPYIAAFTESGEIAGYAYASAFHPRKAYEHCAELSIYISGKYHRKGLGRQLYAMLEKTLSTQGIVNLYACIAVTNRPNDKYLTNASPLFHEHCGFRTIGVFKDCGYKFNKWYSMIWMEKKLLPVSQLPSSEPEVWDIYDVNRQPTGRIMLRGSPNKKGDYHIVVHICIFNKNGEMLIQQRAHNKKGWPDKWDFSIGGHVIAGETSRQGAERELSEELGLNISLTDAPYFTINFSDGFDDYYLVQFETDVNRLTLQKSEVQKVMYASEETIKYMISDGSFIDYHEGLVDLLYAMKKCRGAHVSSGTQEAQKA